MKVGVAVMRVQCPLPHEGHRALIKRIAEENDEVCIVLGVSPTRLTRKNPLSYEARVAAIISLFPELYDKGEMYFIAMPDRRSDETWSKQLDEKIHGLGNGEDEFTLYGARDSFLKYYTGNLPTVEMTSLVFKDQEVDPNITATGLRQKIYDNPNGAPARTKDIESFNEGFIAAVATRYPTSFQAVDAAVFIETGYNNRFLVVGRKPGEELYRFPGGFVDPKLDSDMEGLLLEGAAARELREETTLVIEPKSLEYVGSFRVNDWRYKDGEDKIGTVLYTGVIHVTSLGQIKLKASDDLGFVDAFPINTLKESDFMPEHRPLFRKLCEHVI